MTLTEWIHRSVSEARAAVRRRRLSLDTFTAAWWSVRPSCCDCGANLSRPWSEFPPFEVPRPSAHDECRTGRSPLSRPFASCLSSAASESAHVHWILYIEFSAHVHVGLPPFCLRYQDNEGSVASAEREPIIGAWGSSCLSRKQYEMGPCRCAETKNDWGWGWGKPTSTRRCSKWPSARMAEAFGSKRWVEF